MDFPAVSAFLTALPPWGQTLSGLAALALASWFANLIVKRVILTLIERGISGMGFETGRAHLDPVARRLANVVPAVVVSRGIALVPYLSADAIALVRNVTSAFIVLTVVLAMNAALDSVNAIYQHRPRAASRPIKGYIQVVKMVLYGAAAILIIAALMEQSPLLLLSGLGAMAAVLMLVFKDTILSLVASVQLTSNDMIRVGDWIEAPQFGADGDVVDIALHTIKIQNFDKTITMIPTYRLGAESFRNWRGMSESGGRRIMRSLHIDQSSIRFLSAEDKAALCRFAMLRPYIEAKQEEIARWNAGLDEGGEDPVNHRELTNIGTFRAYMQAYVSAHPRIHGGMTLLVRQLAPGPEGLPIQIYCFTDTVNWGEYEAIQGDIFDHLLAVLPHFGLRLYQQPGGADLRRLRQSPADPASERGEPCLTD
jgi:miniconductance mechanosensitive channel